MIRWTCASVKRRLARYHDGELSIDQRRAVDAGLSTGNNLLKQHCVLTLTQRWRKIFSRYNSRRASHSLQDPG